jgi:hypothetical protein
VGTGPHPIYGAPTGLNPDKIIAQIIELLLYLSLTRVADRNNADNRAYANGNAENRQRTAQLVP